MEDQKEFREKLDKDMKGVFDEFHKDKFPKSIIMNNIPPETKVEFVEWSRKHYMENHGFALKFLWDFYKESRKELERLDVNKEVLSSLQALEIEVLKLKEAGEKNE